MVANKRKNLVRVFFSMVSLQIMLPVVFLLGSLGVKFYHTSGLFSKQQATVSLVVDDRDPNLVFHGADEMTYNGRWFDIEKIEKTGHTCTVSVSADEGETALSDLTKISLNETDAKDTHEKKVLPFLFLYFEQPYTWVLKAQPKELISFCCFTSATHEIVRDVALPPPLSI